MRKKKSEMTPIELIDQALKGRTWQEAELAGEEIMARCIAFHAYVNGDVDEYCNQTAERIYRRAMQWAKENALLLGVASVGKSDICKKVVKEIN